MPLSPRDTLELLWSVPVTDYFSPSLREALADYLQQGALTHKTQRLVEFLKALDWLPLAEICPNPLASMPRVMAKGIEAAIGVYYAEKEDKKAVARQKRAIYQQKITDFFKTHVTGQDKRLLEALRDYELEKTGADRNWQHYFWFTSFKQIEAFCADDEPARLTRIAQFKADVDLFVQNRQRLEEGTYGAFYWGFDDLVTLDETLDLSTVVSPTPRHIPAQVQRAMSTLQVSPGCAFTEVRSQFREAVHRHHPDRSGGDSDTMRAAIQAYEVLKQYYSTSQPHSTLVR